MKIKIQVCNLGAEKNCTESIYVQKNFIFLFAYALIPAYLFGNDVKSLSSSGTKCVKAKKKCAVHIVCTFRTVIIIINNSKIFHIYWHWYCPQDNGTNRKKM